MSCMDIDHRTVGAIRICDDEVETVRVEDGALAVTVQDQHSAIISLPIMQRVSSLSLAVNAVAGEYTVTLTAGHELTAGNELYIADATIDQYFSVVNVATNLITLDSPLVKSFPAVGSTVLRVNSNAAVNGSAARSTFTASLPAAAQSSIDVTGIRFHLLDNAAMDDATFGGIAALASGVVLQHVLSDDSRRQLLNAKCNADFTLRVDNSQYATKAPSGYYGFTSDWKISSSHGVTIRLAPGERIDMIVQDDLTNLTSFKAWLYGHTVV